MGKSTLLNALLDEERAIVSEIAGTTRDIIEDVMTIGGVQFRFIDTAGLRDTEDVVESIGIGRAFDRAGKASVILYLVDAVETDGEDLERQIDLLRSKIGQEPLLIPIANKIDKARDLESLREKFNSIPAMVYISATDGTGMDDLRAKLIELTGTLHTASQDVIVSNVRHHQALKLASASLGDVLEGIERGVTGDFLAIDIRKALYHLGEITGAITTEDLLGNIFSKFCIGK
jgi:tRNA modification GTPase